MMIRNKYFILVCAICGFSFIATSANDLRAMLNGGLPDAAPVSEQETQQILKQELAHLSERLMVLWQRISESGIIRTRYIDIARVCQGRLTLSSGTAVTTTDQTDLSTLYFTPYQGDKVALYNGTNWQLYSFTERSLTLASLTSDSNYDVFLYDNSGTLALELSALWTDNVTRADSLSLQDGIYLKDGSTTRRYLGTIRTAGTTTTTDSVTKRFVWNYYNRLPRHMIVKELTDTYTTTDSMVYKAFFNDTAMKFEFVIGIQDEPIVARALAFVNGSNNSGVAMGLNGAATPCSTDNNLCIGAYGSGNGEKIPIGAEFVDYSSIGYQTLEMTQYEPMGDYVIYYGDNGASNIQSGMIGYIR